MKRKVSFKMKACIFNISCFGMTLAVLLIDHSLPLLAIPGVALNAAIFPFLYKNELKELKRILFDRDDDFRGGNFS